MKWIRGLGLVLGMVLLATTARAADFDFLNNLIFRPVNPTFNFVGKATFINRAGVTVATISDTGVLSFGSLTPLTGNVVPFPGIALVPAGVVPQASGTDLVIARSANAIAPTGPGIDGITLRVRFGSKFGTYKLVAVGGTTFGPEVTIVDNIPTFNVSGVSP